MSVRWITFCVNDSHRSDKAAGSGNSCVLEERGIKMEKMSDAELVKKLEYYGRIENLTPRLARAVMV